MSSELTGGDVWTVVCDGSGHLHRVFGNDIIALMPSQPSWDADGEIVGDQIKHRALVKHWRAMGFVSIPGTDTLLLPLSARSAELEG